MPIRQGVVARGQARGRSIVASLCAELEAARIEGGLSYAHVGRAAAISGEQAARICRGESRSVSLVRLAVMFSAVGRQLSCRAYPAGPPIRDAAHIGLLGRFRTRLHPSLTWRVEVPVIQDGRPLQPGPVDLRAWDATVAGNGWTVGIEAETRLGDVQALLRRLALKERDGEIDCLLLVVNDTAHNRRVLAEAEVELRANYPSSPRSALRLLRRAERPTGSALVVL